MTSNNIDFWNNGRGMILYTIDVEDGHKYIHIHGVTESDTDWWETSLCTSCMTEITDTWQGLSDLDKCNDLQNMIDMRIRYCERWEDKLIAETWMENFVGNWVVNDCGLNDTPILLDILSVTPATKEGYYISKPLFDRELGRMGTPCC